MPRNKSEVRLFIRVPAELKTELFKQAKKKKSSVADVIRTVLTEEFMF